MLCNFDGLSFKILHVGIYTHTPGHFNVKPRPFAAFSCRLSGEGNFVIDGKRLEVEAGNIVFIPADMPYEVDYSSGQSIAVHLRDCNYLEAESMAAGDKKAVESAFFRMLSAWQDGRSANLIKSDIFSVLAHLEDAASGAPADAELELCLQYIEKNLGDAELTVERLCREMHVSRSVLQRRFLKHLGVTPNRYIVKSRLNRALNMLAAGDMSVRSVAYTCGFSDEKYFSRVFKRAFGYPPVNFNSGPHA